MAKERSSYTTGLILGVLAYLMWGVFPLYFHLLDGVPPVEVVAHRIVWSLAFILIIIVAMKRWHLFISVFKNRRALALLALASVLITINWSTYVYAVESDQVVQASFGYIVTPLVSVGLGVFVLRENLRNAQWVSIAIAVLAVIVLAFSYGGLPWVALTLAFSFGLYGLVKKLAGVDAIESLAVETTLLAPLALIYLGVIAAHGSSAIASGDFSHAMLFVLLGPVTAIPLLAFGGSAIRIPLSTLGPLQFITPGMQFLIGWLVFGEVMNTLRWVGFAIIVVSVAVFMSDSWKHRNDNTQFEADIEELETKNLT